MKKIYAILGLLSISLLSFGQNLPINFEPTGNGATWTWTTFENGPTPPPLEIVANPNPSGINTSSTVAKFTAIPTTVTTASTYSQQFAGVETSHGSGIGTFSIDSYNAKIKIMVYKNRISDVGLKLVTSSNASLGQIKVANTLINQWEELTFDFSSHINSVYNPFDKLVIFPDWASRSSDEIIYFDNISSVCAPSKSTVSLTSCLPYTAPDGNLISTAGTHIVTLTNASFTGCDSIITINLAGTNVTTSSLTISSCSAYTAPSGNVYSVTGIHKDTLKYANFAGCDSIITIDLTITIDNQTISSAETSVCAGNATTITVGSSETVATYTLRNDIDNSIIDGPISGTGGSLTFNTGSITTNTTYYVYAEKNAVLGQALSFDGSQDYIYTNINIKPSQLSSFTFEAWVYPKEIYASRAQTVFSNNERNLFIQAGTNNWFLNIGGGAFWSTATVDLNQWQHIAVAFDDANQIVRFYKNGVEYTDLFGPVTNFSNTGLTQMYIGADPDLNFLFKGNIDDVKVWSTHRSSTEIDDNKSLCLSGNETGLIGYFKLDDGYGTTTLDDASSANNNAFKGTGLASPNLITGHQVCATCATEFPNTVTVTLCNTTNIKENAFGNNVTMFPNPTNGKFTIELGNIEEAVTVRVMSIAGQIVEENSYENTNVIEMETKQPPGIYFVEVTNTDAKKTLLKLIKE